MGFQRTSQKARLFIRRGERMAVEHSRHLLYPAESGRRPFECGLAVYLADLRLKSLDDGLEVGTRDDPLPRQQEFGEAPPRILEAFPVGAAGCHGHIAERQ